MSDVLATLRHPPFPPRILGQAGPTRPALKGAITADVCVIGAGYTGLSTALHLARAGRKVVVLEAWRAGHGASGRNGGQVWSGQRQDQITLERMVGRDHAAKLWQFGRDGVNLVKTLVHDGAIDCDLQDGAIVAAYREAEVAELRAYADHLAQHCGASQTPLDRDAIRRLIRSDRFAGGLYDPGSAHLNPFAYAQGLARMTEDAGAVIYEESRVLQLLPGRAETEQGHVTAPQVVLAGNGYLGNLDPDTATRIMPLNNFIVVTEPLDPDAALTARHCVADTRHVVNYFRTTADNRLVFGGGESFGTRFPSDIAAKVRAPMRRIFPHLKDVRIDAAWGGTLAITRTRMPRVATDGKGLWISCGYSGHGLATATLCGALISKAIEGDSAGLDCMTRLPSPAFPGGAMLRSPLLVTAMAWFALRDRLGI